MLISLLPQSLPLSPVTTVCKPNPQMKAVYWSLRPADSEAWVLSGVSVSDHGAVAVPYLGPLLAPPSSGRCHRGSLGFRPWPRQPSWLRFLVSASGWSHPLVCLLWASVWRGERKAALPLAGGIPGRATGPREHCALEFLTAFPGSAAFQGVEPDPCPSSIRSGSAAVALLHWVLHRI